MRASAVCSSLLLGLSLFAVPAGAADDAGGCLGPASTALALRDGRAARLGDVARPLLGTIVRADLCRGDGGLVYRIVVLDDLGRVRRVVLDATSGRLVYDGRGTDASE